jgi:hypothetical protein
MIGIISAVLTFIGIVVAVYYGHRPRSPRPEGSRIVVRVVNAIPTYDLPDGSAIAGDHYISVEATNLGDGPIALTGWGMRLPHDRRMVVTRQVNWATPLPHELRPGAPPARFLVAASELRQLEAREGISFEDMRPYVTLADGTEVSADRTVPLE